VGFGFADISGLRWFARDRTGDDERIRPHEFRGGGSFPERDIGGNGVGGVLLFDVGPNLKFFGADLFAIAEQFSGAGLNHSFISDVREDKTFDTHPIQRGGVSNGYGFAICGGKNLQTDRSAKLCLTACAIMVMDDTISGPTVPRK